MPAIRGSNKQQGNEDNDCNGDPGPDQNVKKSFFHVVEMSPRQLLQTGIFILPVNRKNSIHFNIMALQCLMTLP
jgi:hypothetical protein